MPPAFNLSQDQTLHLELPAPKGQSIKERTWTSGHYCLGVTDVTHWSGSLCIGCFPNTGARTSHLRTLSKIRSRNPKVARPPSGSVQTSRPGEPHIIDQSSKPSSLLGADPSHQPPAPFQGHRSAGRASYVLPHRLARVPAPRVGCRCVSPRPCLIVAAM